MLITDVLAAALIAISFFTFFPVPKIDFTERRMKYVPLMMPLVGLINGLLAFLLFNLLSDINISVFLKASIMCLYFVLFTGGLHIDGLMDTADAYFSRQPKEKKLEIMKDSGVGAFAVITVIFVLLLKTAIIYELFINNNNFSIYLIFIPIISRILQSSMLYFFPAAKPNGLARMYGNLDKRYSLILLLFLMLSAVIEVKVLLLFAVAFLYYIFFYFSSKKQFGGITGDLLGAFLEIAELIMFGTLLFI